MRQHTNFDFSTPHRLDVKAFWLNISTIIWKLGRGFLPLILLMGIKNGFSGQKIGGLFILALLLGVALVRAIVKYKMFTFQVLSDELLVKDGWLMKVEKSVKFDKIHEVNLNQKFVHKLLNIYNVSIDTAGSAKTEISIDGISLDKAMALKDALTQRHVFDHDEVLVDEDGQFVMDELENSAYKQIKIGFWSLFKIGITRNYLQTFGLIVAFGFQIIDQLESIFYVDSESIYDDIFTQTEQLAAGFFLAALILIVIVFVVAFNLLRTLWSYYNYKIQLKSEQILVSFGLTDTHQITVPASKVQLFQFQQNYLQRWMNLYEIAIKQVESKESKKKKMGLIVPGANTEELEKIYEVIYGSKMQLPNVFHRPHKRMFIIRFLFSTIVILFLTLTLLFQSLQEYLPYLFGGYVVLIVLQWVGYRSKKLFVLPNFIVYKSGVWDVKTTFVKINKLQQLQLSQSIFQRNKGLGNLTLSTAAGRVRLSSFDFQLLQGVANSWLYEIEKNRYKWT